MQWCHGAPGFITSLAGDDDLIEVRTRIAALASDAGLVGVRWLLPAESGFFQPLLIART